MPCGEKRMPGVRRVTAMAHRRDKRVCLRWGWQMARSEGDIRYLEQNLVMNVKIGRRGGIGVTLRVVMRWEISETNLMEKSRVGVLF